MGVVPGSARSDATAPTPLAYSSPAGRWTIAATVLGSGMAAIDATVIGIALPTIGRDFHASLAALQWVVTGYTLTLAALLLLGGSLGDRFGRRRAFMCGVVWFALASSACALAQDPGELIATRVLQGIGGALLTPGSLAILEASFRPDDRGRAIGAWSGLGGVATAAGPLLGGYLISAASWRWIFLINVPVGALVLLLAARHVPESSDPEASPRLDFAGVVLAAGALAGIAAAFIEGPTTRWDAPLVLASGVGGIACGVAFVLVEWRAPAPMLPLGLFKGPQFAMTNVVTFVVYAALSGVLFLLPVELQVAKGYSPLESGAALLPITAMMLAFSARSGRLAAVIGPRAQMTTGPIVVGLGFALLIRVPTGGGYVSGVLPAVLVVALGLVVTVAPLTATALGSVPASRAGIASAVNNDVARIGGLIAVAVLPAAAGISGSSYLHPIALSHGFRTAAALGACWCALGGVLAGLGIRNPERPRPDERGTTHCALEATPLRGREAPTAP